MGLSIRGDLISQQIFDMMPWPEKIYSTGKSKFEEDNKKVKIEEIKSGKKLHN